MISIALLLYCNKRVVNLTPDIIRAYGLDRNAISNIQFEYRIINIYEDSSVSSKEPTIFRCAEPDNTLISEDASPAASGNLSSGNIVMLKNGTLCKIVDVKENGKVLSADFGQMNLDFTLSYRSGYAFELSDDTITLDSKKYIRSRIPLMQSYGLLALNKRTLEKLHMKEIQVEGKKVERNAP